MSKDDKKAEYTPADNVAANKVAAETVATDVASDAKPAKSRASLSKGAIIGLSAAGVAVILGAGFTGAAIANGSDHAPRGAEHSQFDGGQQGGRDGGKRDGHRDDMGGVKGQTGQTGPNGQFVDPDPNDNDGPGTGVAPQMPAPTTPGATTQSN